MNARMVAAEPKPRHLDDLVGLWDDDSVAQITGQQGNSAFQPFRDVVDSRVVALSVWDRDADADAAGPDLGSHMASVSHHLASPPRVGRLGVAAASWAVASTGSV